MDRFSGRVSVITGAGSGIGEETAIRLANDGSTVILVGRTKSKLEMVAEKINRGNEEPKAEVFAADVTDEDSIMKLKDHISNKYGNLHHVVNNAGSSGKGKILNLTVDEWDRIQQTNLRSVFLVSKHLGDLMVKAHSSDLNNNVDRSIVNVASLSGHKAGAQIPHYSASKAAVINFTKALAVELAPYGIRVNSVSPGFVETPLTEKGLENARFQEAIKRNTALGRVGRPEEIANIITFIASSEASYMTGSDVLVDGGWLIT
jgi:meso-butanediol dehydrogenase/(S,S)-butanediol dehydrogenase/diacetyl reductase